MIIQASFVCVCVYVQRLDTAFPVYVDELGISFLLSLIDLLIGQDLSLKNSSLVGK